MQKVTLILALLWITGINQLSAQTQTAATGTSSLKLTDGKNIIPTPDEESSFQFVKRGDESSEVVFIDVHDHTSMPVSTNGQVPAPCKFPIPGACFGTPNSSETAMCFCKPTNLSSGEHTFKRAVLVCRKASGKHEND